MTWTLGRLIEHRNREMRQADGTIWRIKWYAAGRWAVIRGSREAWAGLEWRRAADILNGHGVQP